MEYTPRTPYDASNPMAQQGKTSVLFFRLLKDALTKAGRKMAFQTEHSETIANETSSTLTKDGAVTSSGGATVEYAISTILAKNDPLVRELKDAVFEGHTVECWEVNIDEDIMNEDGQYLATYMQGKLNGWESTKNSEENVTVSSTLIVSGRPQEGYLDLTDSEKASVQYAFRTLAAYAEDAVAPVAPTILPVLIDGAEVISGTAEAGAVVTSFNTTTDEYLGSALASTEGAFSIPVLPLETGDQIRVVAKDSAGNVSPATMATVTA